LLAASLALAILALCVSFTFVAAQPPAPSTPPAPGATPPAPPAARDSGKVVDVQIDDTGIQTSGEDDRGVKIDGEFGDVRVRGKIEISEDGDTIVVHKTGPFRVESSTSDVVRMGSDITIGPEEVVQGDAVSIGGNVEVLGQVMGDAVSIGGMLHLGPEARVNGDAVSIGGTVEKDPGAEVNGETVSIGVPLPPFGPFAHTGSGVGHKGRIGTVFAKIFMLAMMAFFIFLTLSFWREKVVGMARLIPERPWLMLMLGVSVWILFVPACILLVISIVGILFLPVFIVLVFVGFILGLVTVYHFVGERFRGGAYAGRPFATTFLGLLIVHCFSILGAILGAIAPGLSPLPGALSIFGTMLAFFAATVGIGCVLHTRFGRRNMPLATPPEAGTTGASTDWGWTAPPPPPDLGPGRGSPEGVPPIPDVPKG
jgi:hypothetical protein